MIKKNSSKYKYLTKNELIVNLDRLSRFKLPEEAYQRVFYDVILKCLISPKYSINELDNLPVEEVCKLFKFIWNKSVEYNYGINKSDKHFNILKAFCLHLFKNTDKKTKAYINTNIYINSILKNIENTEAKNLKNLKLNLNKKNNELIYPIRKLIIVEGITEEILLPVFSKKLGCDFEKNGIYIMGAGGKSKSPALYMKLRNKLKIPIILLFDCDAKEICEEMKNVLLKKDKIIMIKNGEFEDILSLNLIKRALNKEYETLIPIKKKDLKMYSKMCKNLENIYRIMQLGEFKKAKFAKIIAENIKYKSDLSQEIKDIISCINNI